MPAERGPSGTGCGHDPAQFVTADEGTGYCPACEAASRPSGTGHDTACTCRVTGVLGHERRCPMFGVTEAAPAPVVVWFEETGEKREVKTWCLRCQADSDFTIVSPGGKAHYSSETGEDTRCGIDATGDQWWHRL